MLLLMPPWANIEHKTFSHRLNTKSNWASVTPTGINCFNLVFRLLKPNDLLKTSCSSILNYSELD